jgi:hypothetical protein
MHDVTSVEYVDSYRLKLRFDDKSEGIVDLKPIIERGGVFAPLGDPDFFRQVCVNTDIGTICWPNGADVCPDTLYAMATGKPLPDWAEEPLRK